LISLDLNLAIASPGVAANHFRISD